MTELNLDAANWTPACPVLLPFGPLTSATIMSASYGVFFPFLLFVGALFYHLYGVWATNAAEDRPPAAAKAAPVAPYESVAEPARRRYLPRFFDELNSRNPSTRRSSFFPRGASTTAAGAPESRTFFNSR